MSILGRSGIYEIQNTLNGKRYVGSAVSVRRRLTYHKSLLNTNKHFNVKLQNAFNKYGKDNFVFNLMFPCLKEQLISYEQQCIDGFDTVNEGYNIRPIANSTLGMKLSEEHKRKIGLAGKGRKGGGGWKHTEEWKKGMSARMRGNTWSFGNKNSSGHKVSDELKEHFRRLKLGKPNSEESKLKASLRLKGRKWSDAQRENSKNRVCSDETRLKISAVNKGRKHSEEAKLHMSLAAKNRVKRWKGEIPYGKHLKSGVGSGTSIPAQ